MQWIESPLATDYLNPLLVFSIRLSMMFVWIKLRKRSTGWFSWHIYASVETAEGDELSGQKTLPGMGLVIGTAIKEVVRREVKCSLLPVLHPGPLQLFLFGFLQKLLLYASGVKISMNITLYLVDIIHCAAVIIRKEQLQADFWKAYASKRQL